MRKTLHTFEYLILSIILFTAFTFNILKAAEEDAKALKISTDAYNYDKGFGDFISNQTMTLRNKQGEETVRYFRGKTLEVANDGDKTLFIFDSPKDVKGTATLTFSHKVGPDDQWLYLPALKRVKRITSENRSGSFVGSEFAYEDLGSQELEKYSNRKYIKEEPCPEKNQLTCHVITRVPVEKSSGYSYQTLWLDETPAHKVWKIEYYDRKKALLKTLIFGDYKIYLDKYWRPSTYKMINHQTGKSTDLFVDEIKFKVGLTERDFNQKSLSRVR
jgi:hypothetical protein